MHFFFTPDCVCVSHAKCASLKASIDSALAQAEAAGAMLDLHVDMPRPPSLPSPHAGHAHAPARVSVNHAQQNHSAVKAERGAE